MAYDYKTQDNGIFIYLEPTITPEIHGSVSTNLGSNDEELTRVGIKSYIPNTNPWIRFYGVDTTATHDFLLDFWFWTTSNDWARIMDFGPALNASYKFLGSNGTGNLDNDKVTGYNISIPRGNKVWNHIAYQYNYTTKTLRLYLNGVLKQAANNVTSLSGSTYAWIGKSAYGSDPLGNFEYAAIRIQYKALFDSNFSIITRTGLHYPNTAILNNFKVGEVI